MTDENVNRDDEATEAFQIIRDNQGNPSFVAVPYAEFDKLMEQARRAAGLEAAADAIRNEMNRLALIPSEVVHRIADGEHPIRVWRLHRGLKAVELARDAGISPGYLSEIETSKKDGTFRTMAQIARILGVRLDDLMPVIDEEEIDVHRREVQLRDIARRISEIDSMINGTQGFDSGAVHDAARKLIQEAQAFMDSHGGRFNWLERVVERARRIIEEINATERSIIKTVVETQGRLSDVFADSLSRAGLFPSDMMRPRGEPAEPAPAPNGGGQPEPAAPAPEAEEEAPGEVTGEAAPEEEIFEPGVHEEGEEPEGEAQPRGGFVSR